MATLKANGGVFRYLDKPATGDKPAQRLALCQNGHVLRKVGDGWKHAAKLKEGKTLAEAVADLERHGFAVDASGAALGMQSRTRTDAHCHQQAIAGRRLDRATRDAATRDFLARQGGAP